MKYKKKYWYKSISQKKNLQYDKKLNIIKQYTKDYLIIGLDTDCILTQRYRNRHLMKKD